MLLQTLHVDGTADYSHHGLSGLLRTKDEIHLEIYAMTTDEGVREMSDKQGYAHLLAEIAELTEELNDKRKFRYAVEQALDGLKGDYIEIIKELRKECGK